MFQVGRQDFALFGAGGRMKEAKVSSSLRTSIHFCDEWPSRVAKFITDLAEWYAAHPSLKNFSSDDITAFLLNVAETQGFMHKTGTVSVNRDTAGETTDMVESVIDFDNLRRCLTLAAFERYGYSNVA